MRLVYGTNYYGNYGMTEECLSGQRSFGSVMKVGGASKPAVERTSDEGVVRRGGPGCGHVGLVAKVRWGGVDEQAAPYSSYPSIYVHGKYIHIYIHI